MAIAAGHRKITFVSSMCDIFESDKTFKGKWLDHTKQPIDTTFDEQRAKAFSAIDTMPEIHFLLLTKRPQNILNSVPDNPHPIGGKHVKYRDNVSYGTSAGTQKTWDSKVKQLMRLKDTLSPSLFVSCEPMLEPVDIQRNDFGWQPDVIFCGGESAGRDKVRPMDLRWSLDLRDQCLAIERGPMFHFKQLGSYAILDGAPLRYKHPKGEDPKEWPRRFGLSANQSVPEHWRAKL